MKRILLDELKGIFLGELQEAFINKHCGASIDELKGVFVDLQWGGFLQTIRRPSLYRRTRNYLKVSCEVSTVTYIRQLPYGFLV